jgi:hypothetical protein
MVRALAPTARRIPISRVRSVTLTSITFVTPIAPTTSETAPSRESSNVTFEPTAPDVFSSSSSVRTS